MNLKDIIESGMDYLEKNDLSGFYTYIYMEHVLMGNKHRDIIPNITSFLEKECGINTVESFLMNDPVIPPLYCYNSNDLPSSVYDSNTRTLSFPPEIKEIGTEAFTNCMAIDHLDIRNIEYLNRRCFEGIEVDDARFGVDTMKDLLYNGQHHIDSVFYHATFSVMIIPKRFEPEEEDIRKLFENQCVYAIQYY